jgi:hypothetical protein
MLKLRVQQTYCTPLAAVYSPISTILAICQHNGCVKRQFKIHQHGFATSTVHQHNSNNSTQKPFQKPVKSNTNTNTNTNTNINEKSKNISKSNSASMPTFHIKDSQAPKLIFGWGSDIVGTFIMDECHIGIVSSTALHHCAHAHLQCTSSIHLPFLIRSDVY